jgi:hypothetical protein
MIILQRKSNGLYATFGGPGSAKRKPRVARPENGTVALGALSQEGRTSMDSLI